MWQTPIGRIKLGLGFGASFLNRISEYHLYLRSVEIGPYRKQTKKKKRMRIWVALAGSPLINWLWRGGSVLLLFFPTLGLCCGSGTELEPRGRGVTTIQIQRVGKKIKIDGFDMPLNSELQNPSYPISIIHIFDFIPIFIFFFFFFCGPRVLRSLQMLNSNVRFSARGFNSSFEGKEASGPYGSRWRETHAP